MFRRRAALLAVPLLVAVLLASCQADPKSPAGFRLPDGDVERGRVAFVALGCPTCHAVPGADVPPPTATTVSPVTLGGEVSIVKTDGELVTSILLPSHRIAPVVAAELQKLGGVSPMPPNYQDAMTVRQLVDVVAFLQSRYRYAGMTSVAR